MNAAREEIFRRVRGTQGRAPAPVERAYRKSGALGVAARHALLCERLVDYGARRESVMAQARARARQLAEEGLSAAEIQGRLDYRLTDTERELMTPIIRQEVVAARRARVARTMDAKENTV